MGIDEEELEGGVKAWGITLIAVIVLLLIAHGYAVARDLGQWEATDPAVRE